MYDYRHHPYGAYLCHGSVVYFDRRYQPIVRLTQPDWSATICDPRERIQHSGKEWLYRDATSPRRNAQTRNNIQHIMDAIPELAAEVRRRNSAQVIA
jgi:hypothetical protein